MTEEKQNIAIYKLLGFEPRKMWRVWYNKDKSYGLCYIPSKEEALKRIEIEKASWRCEEYPKEFEFSEPEEYEDWSCCPKVDLDLLYEAEDAYITSNNSETYDANLCLAMKNEPDYTWHANVSQRKKALLKTLNLWE